MVVIITMGARDFSWASFRFRSSLYQKSRENELINSCVYILLFLPWISILAFIKEQMVSYVFFSFFWKKRQEEARNKRLINSVSLIQRCWRRHQRRRENAAVKIQSGKTTTVEARHSVFLPKQESSKFVLKTTPFTTPLFSTNDHLLGSSVVIFLKILGRFSKVNAMSNGSEDDLC